PDEYSTHLLGGATRRGIGPSMGAEQARPPQVPLIKDVYGRASSCSSVGAELARPPSISRVISSRRPPPAAADRSAPRRRLPAPWPAEPAGPDRSRTS